MQHNDRAKQLLYISAPTNKTIAEKIAIVSEEKFVEQLTKNSLTIAQLPTLQIKTFEQTSTFKQLQIPNVHLSGKKQTTEYYFVSTPPTFYETEQASLQLHLKIAETLKFENHDDAELVVYVNDVPHSNTIESLEKEESTSFYSVHVPIDTTTLQQESYVSLRLEANGLRDHDICVSPNEDLWVYIHEDSLMTLPDYSFSREANFGDWPLP